MARYSSLAEGASFTREVYRIDQKTGKSTRAGYARFTKRTGADGRQDDVFQGTGGGYGRNGNRNSASRKGSKVQNTANSVAGRQAARRPAILR